MSTKGRGNTPLGVQYGGCSGGGRVGGLLVPAALARLLVVVEGAVRMVVQDVPLGGGRGGGGGVGGGRAIHVIHCHRGSVLDQFTLLHWENPDSLRNTYIHRD